MSAADVSRLSARDVQHLFHALHEQISETNAMQYPLVLLPKKERLVYASIKNANRWLVIDTTDQQTFLRHRDNHVAIVETLGAGMNGTVFRVQLFVAGADGEAAKKPLVLALKTQPLASPVVPIIAVEEGRRQAHGYRATPSLEVRDAWCMEPIALHLQYENGFGEFVPRVYATLLLEMAPDEYGRVHCLCTLMDLFDPDEYERVRTWEPPSAAAADTFVGGTLRYLRETRRKLDLRNYDMNPDNVLVQRTTGAPVFIDPSMTVITDPATRTTYVFTIFAGLRPWKEHAGEAVSHAILWDASRFWFVKGVYSASLYDQGVSARCRDIRCQPKLLKALDSLVFASLFATPDREAGAGTGTGAYVLNVHKADGASARIPRQICAASFLGVQDAAMRLVAAHGAESFVCFVDATLRGQGVAWLPITASGSGGEEVLGLAYGSREGLHSIDGKALCSACATTGRLLPK